MKNARVVSSKADEIIRNRRKAILEQVSHPSCNLKGENVYTNRTSRRRREPGLLPTTSAVRNVWKHKRRIYNLKLRLKGLSVSQRPLALSV